MKRAAVVCLLLLSACRPVDERRPFTPPMDLPPPAPPVDEQVTRTVALTFDDLPGVFRDSSLAVARAANEALLQQLRDDSAHATGFVNEDKLRGTAERTALLELWLDAGMDLGNHTYSHPDLHDTPLEQYQADVLRGERVTRPLMQRRGLTPRWFRHPFLHSGRSLQTRQALEAFLQQHGYTVAPVTVDNYDYVFARAYERAPGGDRARVLDAYVAYMDTVFGYYEAQSRSLFQREPAQVLLLHVNQLNADAMVVLLSMMRRRGYRVVPLEEALRDPVYRSEDGYTGQAGITWLHRWAMTRGVRGAAFAGEPAVPPWVEALAR